MSARNSNTSFLIGLAISAAVHIFALFALQHIKLDPHRMKLSLAALTPSATLPMADKTPPMPEEKPDDPDQPKPPPPPKDVDHDIRFGIDNSNNQTKTWLGFLEGDTPTGMQGTVEQAAMSLDPGAPGAPGSAAAAPTQATPENAPSTPAPPPSENPIPAKPPEDKPAEEAQPEKAAVPAPAPSRTAVPLPASLPGVKGETSDSKDPLANRAGTPDAKAGERVENSKPKDAPDAPELPKEPVTDKPDTKPGVDREGENRPTETEKKSDLDGKGEDAKEIEAKEVTALLAQKPPEMPAPTDPPPAEVQPPAEKAAPSTPQPPTPSATPSAGGQAKLKGIRSDRESEAVTNKIVDVVNRDGRVAAGRGLNIRTRRADFTNTTLLTAPPRDTLVRISFQKGGEVKRAEFVDGTSTGNPNVDDPLLNAIYRWRASGSDLTKLRDSDTLSVIVRVTFK